VEASLRLKSSTLVLAIAALGVAGCFRFAKSQGGGQIEPASGERRVSAADVMLPAGYSIHAVSRGLTFPTAVAFDLEGTPHVVEAGYSYGEIFTEARLLRLEQNGRRHVLARSDNGPWTGVVYHDGAFYVAEGGQRRGGRILRIAPNGRISVLVEGLPSLGDHHTNGPAIGSDGYVYFGQGTATNSAVVGEDNAQFGWLSRHPGFHDVPCQDVVLRGVNFESKNDNGERVLTGAYMPLGTPSRAGQKLAGALPCNGAILRVPLTGGKPELVAWGFRNPFGLAFDTTGTLYVTDNGADVRGSRPIFGAADVLWRVEPGRWYGWPDFSEGRSVANADRQAPKQPVPPQLLAEHPNRPPKPAAFFGVHSSSNGIDFSRSPAFGYVGDGFVAQFGDQSPATGKTMAPVGFKVVRVELASGVIHDFARNRGRENGPASKLGHRGLERPVGARFNPAGDELWVVDFGILAMTDDGHSLPQKETGVLWRIRRSLP
jgi:glucose/arabinose dehydrogenase